MPKTTVHGGASYSEGDPRKNEGTVTVGLVEEEGEGEWDTKTSSQSSEKPAKKSATKKVADPKPARTTEHHSKK